MAKTIGVILSERIVTGLVVNHALVGTLRAYPDDLDDEQGLVELHTESLVEAICTEVCAVASGHTDVDAIGVALPGLIRNNVVEDSPNLPQLKGARIGELLQIKLQSCGVTAPVTIMNDADGLAAGLATSHGKLDSLVRVWTLGVGIGYGRYPFVQGAWQEGGHAVVTLDEKERFCGCGGRGHMEGIMGHRAMRLRFLDMEPEEVFEAANSLTEKGMPANQRCLDFKRLWHKAIAAATASSVHQDGAGKFFLTGFNARFVDLPMLRDYLQQMIKMSPLQGYSVEVVRDDPANRIIGAGTMAEQAAELAAAGRR